MQMTWALMHDSNIIAQVVATEANIKRIVDLMNKGETID